MLRTVLLIFTITLDFALAACTRPVASDGLTPMWQLPESASRPTHPLEGVWRADAGGAMQIIQTEPDQFFLRVDFGSAELAVIEVLDTQRLVTNDGTAGPYQRLDLMLQPNSDCLVGVQTIKNQGVVTHFDVRWCREVE